MCELDKQNPDCILLTEPLPNVTPEQWIAVNHDCKTEFDLATAFAGASNEAGWLDDEIYDEDCTAETIERYYKWRHLADELRKRVLQIFERENPQAEIKPHFMRFLTPVMQRNGFANGSGWWIPIKADK